MKKLLTSMATVIAVGTLPAAGDEIKFGPSFAFLDNSVTHGSNVTYREEGDGNAYLIKEDEFASPELLAVIERNREDRERTVIIDR